MAYICPICGYPDLDKDPRFALASTLWCLSCGFDFGITDDASFVSYEQRREEWIADGMPWKGPKSLMPAAWDPAAQIKSVVTSVPMFLPPKTPQPEDRIEWWIGASPMLREQPMILSAFLSDLVDISRLYGDVRIETDEPCVYLDTERGWNVLYASLVRGNINQITIHSGSWSDPPGSGYATVRLGSITPVVMASHFSMSIRPSSRNSLPVPIKACVDLIQRWFVPLGGAAVGFSHGACGTGIEGRLYLTQREREHGKLETWDAIRRYVRGTFWSTALGPDHCEQLGGQARVLCEAPAPIVRPLGGGVWLQLSEQPPADLDAVERLAAYLAPLQQWTTKDATIHRRYTVPIVDRRPNRFFPRDIPASLRLAAVPSRVVKCNYGAAVPITILEKPMWYGQIGINIHLSVAPTTAHLHDLQGVLEEWFQTHDGYFIDGPTCLETIVRWNSCADFGYVGRNRVRWYDQLRQTFQPLSERLAALPNIDIEQMVIGRETVE